jgi:hypothetical protein
VQIDEVEKAKAEEYLAELPDPEFLDVLRRVRPPKSAGYPAKRRRSPAPSSTADAKPV